MIDKQKIIEEIVKFPLKYAVMKDLKNENGWDKEKLEYMDMGDLKWLKRDLETFERNLKRLNGQEQD